MTEPEITDALLELLDCTLADMRAGRTIDLAAWREQFPEHIGHLPKLLETVQALETAVEDWRGAATLLETFQQVIDEPFPTEIGRFKIECILGSGGMGTVYKAHDPQLDRAVAVKVPHFDMAPSAKAMAVQRFLREAKVAARVRHPNVCPMHDVGEADGRPYVVMAFIEGQSLKHLLKSGPLDPAHAADLVAKVALGLEAVHKEGIVHRDVKPANIMLDAAGHPYLTDFGLARPISDKEALTQHGLIVGTPGFMAPEQAQSHAAPIGPWTDVFSLGMVLYSALAGQLPFSGPALHVLLQNAAQDAPPPSKFRAGLDAGLDAIVMKAVARDARERYQSAGEMGRSLRGWIARTAVQSGDLHRPILLEIGDQKANTPVSPTVGLSEAGSLVAAITSAHPDQIQKQSRGDTRVIEVSGFPGGQSLAVTVPSTASKVQVSVTESKGKKKKRRWLLRVTVAMSILLAVVGLASGFAYQHKRSLESSIQGHVAKGEFGDAFAATDGVLALPFRSGLRESIRQDAVAFAKDTLPKNAAQATDICQAAAVYYPNDADVRELWTTALEKLVLGADGLVARGQFEAAVKRVEQLPGESAGKTRLTSGIETAWLRAASGLLDEANWTQASTTLYRLLDAFPENTKAKDLQKLAAAATDAEHRLASGDHLGALQAVPVGGLAAPNGLFDKHAAALQKLRSDVNQKWSEQATRLSVSDRLADVRKALEEWRVFKIHHPGQPDNLSLAQRQFCKLAVPEAGRLARLDDFDAGMELLKQAQQYARDTAEQTDINNQRRQIGTSHRDHLLKQARERLDAKEPKQAQAHLARLADKERDADYGVKDKSVELKTLQARALAQTGADADADKAIALFDEVNVKGNAGLNALCLDLLNSSHAQKAAPVLVTARIYLSDQSVIDRITKLNPGDFLVQAAQKAFPSNAAKAVGYLRGVEIAVLDMATKQTYLRLCEDLTTDYADKEVHYLAPADFKLFEKAAKESAKLANILPKAMAKHIERTVAVWPKDESEWKTRLDMCRKAEPANNPWAKAHLAECMLTLGATDLLPAMNDTDTLAYQTYVRAIRWSQDKKDTDAAQLLAMLSPKEPWFINQRREQAAAVLRSAALQARPVGKLFGTADDAASAYAWLSNAFSLSGNSTKNWPERDRLDFALATHFKAPADSARVEALLADLAEPKDLDPADKDLVRFLKVRSYADALAYLKDHQPKMTATRLLQDRLEPAIELGQAGDNKSAQAKEQQALRFAAKGWLLRQTNALPDARKAFDEAIALDNQKVDYWLERADCEIAANPNWKKLESDATQAIKLASRDARPYSLRALAVLHQARAESQTLTRVDLLTNALQDAEKALAVNPDNETLPKVLYRASMIALELGNYQYRLDAEGTRESKEWKKHIRDSARYAEKILADFPKEESALVHVALGNACEDIAYFVQEDVDTRFAQAEKAFSRALELSGDADWSSRAVSRARCRYRWATVGKAPADTLKTALADIDLALKSKLQPPLAAEANYWKGMIVAAKDPNVANEAFTAALDLADQAPEYGAAALTALFDLYFHDVWALAKANPDAALEKLGKLGQTLDGLHKVDAAAKRLLHARMGLVTGLAYEAKKEGAKAVQAYRSALPADLSSANPTPIDIQLHYRWVFARTLVGPKENLIADADYAVDWSNRMQRAGVTDTQIRWLKADALWTAAVARMYGVANPEKYRVYAVEKLRQCVVVGEGHKDLWRFRAMLGGQLFELMKATKDATVVERHREEALEQLGAALKLAPRDQQATIEAKITEIEKYRGG